MTAKSRRIPVKSPGVREWIFPWREPVRSPWPKLIATGIVTGLFTLLFVGIRVRIEESPRGTERKASVIYLPAVWEEGKAWSLRAREDGPFPSRFEPAAWENRVGLQQAVFDAAKVPLPPYVPSLRDLPASAPSSRIPLENEGDRVFPKRKMTSPVAGPVLDLKLAPTLYPLSGIGAEGMPTQLPPFTAPLDAAATSVPWRSFLIRLRSGGEVAECVSLTGGESVSPALEKWLRTVKFKPGPEWIAIAVAFSNQPDDGPVPR